ncbi:MAG: hypothetical protein Q8Q62_14180 [Mesorhizobium sp.]|nr:hypothetical protein [Mesorhizobium sp.]
MDWKEQAATNDLLDRIVVLLLAIADLAERAAGVPDARRRLVLAIILQGDIVVRDFVRAPDGSPGGAQRAPAAIPCRGHGPEDAMALAMSLRTLALIVRSLAGRTRRLSVLPADYLRDTAGCFGPDHRRSACIGRFPDTAFPPAQRLDTS